MIALLKATWFGYGIVEKDLSHWPVQALGEQSQTLLSRCREYQPSAITTCEHLRCTLLKRHQCPQPQTSAGGQRTRRAGDWKKCWLPLGPGGIFLSFPSMVSKCPIWADESLRRTWPLQEDFAYQLFRVGDEPFAPDPKELWDTSSPNSRSKQGHSVVLEL